MKYPTDIKPLTGLRFFAAFWLLFYFFWQRIGGDAGVRPNFVANGNNGVDLFFILSGFVLAHVYGPLVEDKKFTYRGFMWARFARVYPLHAVTFAMVFGIWIVGVKLGQSFAPHAFDTKQIPFHLTLMHAWGFIKSDGWNFPSWSISAEWFAYLTFPLSFAFVSMFKKRPVLGLGFVVAAFYALTIYFSQFNIILTDMTWQGAQGRIITSFTAGMFLWQIGRTGIFNPKYSRLALGFTIVTIIAVCNLTVSPMLLWPLLLALVFFLAESSKIPGQEVIGSKLWVYLGEISFAMYMVHLPIDIVTSRIVGWTLPQVDTVIQGYLMVGFGIVNTIIAAAILHAVIEKPVRDYLRQRVKFNAPKPKAAHGFNGTKSFAAE